MSLLQRKPEEWRHLHATPSIFSPAPTVGVKTSSASAAPAPAPYAGTTSGTVEPPPGGKVRKKRKRSVLVIEDEIDALFEGALGHKVARSALVVEDSGAAQPPDPMPSSVLTPHTTVTGREKRGGRNADYGLGAVVDAIRAAPRGGEGKKKRVRRPG